jgi:heptosyltransferase-2
MPKFLIIRFSSIGDIVLTTPVIRCLKKQMPDAELHFLTKKSFGTIFKANPYIHKIHLLEDNLNETINLLKKEAFDFIIDLHNNIRTYRVKMGLGVKSYSFEKLNLEKWAMTALKINRLPDVHIVHRYLDTLKTFGIYNDGAGLDYFIPENELEKTIELPKSHQAGFIGLVIGAAVATKRLPLEKLSALCASVSLPIVLLGGPDDASNGERISALNHHVFNACGKFTLHQSANLIKQATLVVTHDTGLMHIAAAFNKSIISIWGNTIPEFGMFPYYEESTEISSAQFEVKNISCRPCSKIGFKECPKGHFKCMENQDLLRIKEKIEFFWVKYQRIQN